MRLIIDTNCLLVSIPRFSSTRWLFDSLKEGRFEFGITTEILEEYEEVIGKYYSPTLASNVVELLPNLKNSVWVTTYYNWQLITSDKDDNKFVDCAFACQADHIISHDRHFNILKEIEFPKISVLKMDELKSILKLNQ